MVYDGMIPEAGASGMSGGNSMSSSCCLNPQHSVQSITRACIFPGNTANTVETSYFQGREQDLNFQVFNAIRVSLCAKKNEGL